MPIVQEQTPDVKSFQTRKNNGHEMRNDQVSPKRFFLLYIVYRANYNGRS